MERQQLQEKFVMRKGHGLEERDGQSDVKERQMKGKASARAAVIDYLEPRPLAVLQLRNTHADIYTCWLAGWSSGCVRGACVDKPECLTV